MIKIFLKINFQLLYIDLISYYFSFSSISFFISFHFYNIYYLYFLNTIIPSYTGTFLPFLNSNPVTALLYSIFNFLLALQIPYYFKWTNSFGNSQPNNSKLPYSFYGNLPSLIIILNSSVYSYENKGILLLFKYPNTSFNGFSPSFTHLPNIFHLILPFNLIRSFFKYIF